MSRIKKLFFILLFSLILLPSQVLAYQLVILGPSNEVVTYKEGTANNDTVFSILKKTGIPYIDEGDKYPEFKGCYITSIAGYGMKQTNGWVYTVNGESPMVAASEYHIKDSDKVIWCAYSNVGNINNYVFPSINHKEETNKIVEPQSEGKVSNPDIVLEAPLEENNIVEEDNTVEENSAPNNVVETFSAKDQYPELYSQLNMENNPVEVKDYCNIGYIGIIVCFILGISLYRFVRKENHNGKGKE